MARGLTLTRALVLRHGANRQDAYGAALLDVAQDFLLETLARAGFFDDGLVFKGGTSLRKCRLGNDGRFSTDLDFAAPDEAKVLAVCDATSSASAPSSQRSNCRRDSRSRPPISIGATGMRPSASAT